MSIQVDLTEILAVVALAIIIAPTIAGWVRMPGIIGFVLAGTLVGPFVLGWLPAGAVDELGKIGLLYLMFQAGLELNMTMFQKHRTSAIIFGILTFAFPFVAGALSGWLVLGFPLAAAVLIGSIWASHTLVTLPDVREAGLNSNRAVVTVAGATIITDTLALIILAVVTAQSGGTPVMVLVKVGVGLLMLSLYCFTVLPWIGTRFFRNTGQERALRFAFLLFALASAGVLSEAFGIEGLVGAFLAGLGVNRLVPKGGPLMEHVDFFGEALFVPAFLVYVGTKLNPAVVVEMTTVEMALLFVLVLAVGKGIAALLGGRILKFTLAESGLMFGMTIPQAAATLAATLVGAEAGLFSDKVVNAVVIVVLVSIIAGSLTTRRFAARVEMPSGSTRQLGLGVLVGLPSDAPFNVLMTVATAMAGEDDGLVMPMAVATGDGKGVAAADRLAQEATDVAEALGTDVEARVRFAESYSGAVLRAIVDRRASSVVTPMATRRSVARRVFGNDLERIGRESPVPVVAVRPGSDVFAKVVLGLDSKADSSADRHDQQLAVNVARALSERLDLPLTVGARTEAAIDALGLPSVAEKLIGPRSIQNHPEVLTAGSVLVVPAALVRRLGPFASEFADSNPDVTLVVVAGPYRLRTSFGVQANASIMGATIDPHEAETERPAG